MRAGVTQRRTQPWVRCTGVSRRSCAERGARHQRDLTRTQCTASISFDPGYFSDGDYVGDQGPRERTKQEVGRAKFRAIMFFTFSMAIAIPLFCLMLILYPFVMIFDKFRRRAEHLVNKIWAVLSTIPFNKVVVRPHPTTTIFATEHSYLEQLPLRVPLACGTGSPSSTHTP